MESKDASNAKPKKGSPGGLDDPLRKGLSGSAVKWYLRYLEQGLEPEKAREKAVTHQRTPSRSTTEEIDSPPAIKKIRSTSINNNMMVALLAKEYPNILLNAIEFDQLEDALVEAMLTSKANGKLQFESLKRTYGFLVFHCANQVTVDWLKEIVGHLETWTGPELTTNNLDNVVVPHLISISLPVCKIVQQPEKLLQLFDVQNYGLRVDRWSVLDIKDCGGEQTINIAVDKLSLDGMEANKWRIYYKFGQITVEKVVKEPYNSLVKPELKS